MVVLKRGAIISRLFAMVMLAIAAWVSAQSVVFLRSPSVDLGDRSVEVSLNKQSGSTGGPPNTFPNVLPRSRPKSLDYDAFERASEGGGAKVPAEQLGHASKNERAEYGDKERVEREKMLLEFQRQLAAEQARLAQSKRLESKESDCIAKLRKRGVIIQSGPCVDIEDVISDLETGEYTFNKPDRGWVDQSFQFVLVLKTAHGQNVETIVGTTPGSKVELKAKYAQFLEATVSGPDLTVEPSGPQSRTVTKFEPVEWHWTITPRVAGRKTLAIEVAANLIVGPEKTHVQLKVLHEDIDVRIGYLQWIRATLTELNAVTGSILALFGALGGLFAFMAPFRRWVMNLFVRESVAKNMPPSP